MRKFSLGFYTRVPVFAGYAYLTFSTAIPGVMPLYGPVYKFGAKPLIFSLFKGNCIYRTVADTGTTLDAVFVVSFIWSEIGR